MLVNVLQHSTDHHWQLTHLFVCTPELLSYIKTQKICYLALEVLFQFRNSVLVY